MSTHPTPFEGIALNRFRRPVRQPSADVTPSRSTAAQHPQTDLVLGALVLLLTLAAGLFYRPVFGDWSFFAPPIIGAAAAAAIIAVIGDRLKVPSGIGQLTQLCCFALVVPGLISLPGSTAGLPSVLAFRSLVDALVDGPARLLTSPIPVPAEQELLIVPVLGAWWGVSLAWLALRHQRPILAMSGPVLAMVVALAFGPLDQSPFQFTTATFCLLAFAYLLTIERRSVRRRSIPRSAMERTRDLVPALATVAVVSLLATVANPLVPIGAGRQRFSLRSYRTPPFDVQALSSPLANYRKFLTPVYQQTEMFTVRGDQPDRWRLATLNAYDGRVWGVGSGSQATGEFDLLGSRFDPTRHGAESDSDKITTISISGLDEPYLPMPGIGVGIDLDASIRSQLRSNRTSNVLVWANGQARQASYTLRWRPQESVEFDKVTTEQFDRSSPIDPLDGVPEALSRYAKDATAGATSDTDIVRMLTKRLRSGYYSLDARAGHSYGAMTRLIAAPRTMVGNEEQYTAALALLLRTLDIPARVAVGFVPKTAGQTTFRGEDLATWVEVRFQKVGWVAVHPTPDHARVPRPIAQDEATGNDLSKPRTQPLPQAEAEQSDSTSRPADQDKPTPQRVRVPIAVRVGLAAIGLPLVGIGLFIGSVMGLKWVRRRRRKSNTDPALRIAGAWHEALERLDDHGISIPRGSTFLEAHRLTGRTTASRHLHALASVCERAAFAPMPPSPALAGAAWDHVHALVDQLKSTAGPRRRLRAAARPRTLRSRSTR